MNSKSFCNVLDTVKETENTKVRERKNITADSGALNGSVVLNTRNNRID